MAVRKRAGFTLVELLVVITIIGMLVGLLVPAVLAAREQARRAKCTNNQSELTKALQQYDLAKQHFPGYVNQVGGSGNTLNWVVVSLPYLGREDLWKLFRDGSGATVRIDQLVCPSDQPPEGQPLSYTANCGNNNNNAAYGVFHDHISYNPPTLVSASSIPDGAQQTILISENVQAHLWTDRPTDINTICDIGILWQDGPGACGLINLCLDSGSRGNDANLARPASYHGNGVVVSYCDGHTEYQNADIDYGVYKHLMTPDSQAAGLGAPPQ